MPVAQGVKANLEALAEVRVWNEDLFEPGRFTLDELLGFTQAFDFAVFVWSGEDGVTSRDQSFLAPRDNLILEAGIFYGALGKERVFLVVPLGSKIKVPTDLLGLTLVNYRTPTDGNYRAAVGSACSQISQMIQRQGSSPRRAQRRRRYPIPDCHHTLEEARESIRKACKECTDIKILSNKGLVFFGLDESIVSLADINDFSKLRKLRIILLDPSSRWVNRGLMALRRHESLEDFKKELSSSHVIVEASMKRFADHLRLHKSGVKYQRGEPYFRAVITDQFAFVSSYAEHPSVQVRDLPVFAFENAPGTLYGAIKRHFNDLWHNECRLGAYLQQTIEHEISAGGILVGREGSRLHVALAMRDDGSWVIPKGHKERKDERLELTAIREVAEELGIDNERLVIEKQLDEYTYDETAEALMVQKIVYLFLMTCQGHTLPTLQPDTDHPAAKWWPLDEPLPFMFYTYQKTLLAETIEAEYRVIVKIP